MQCRCSLYFLISQQLPLPVQFHMLNIITEITTEITTCKLLTLMSIFSKSSVNHKFYGKLEVSHQPAKLFHHKQNAMYGKIT